MRGVGGEERERDRERKRGGWGQGGVEGGNSEEPGSPEGFGNDGV